MIEKKIYLITAMSDNRVIGKENNLPWHYSVDLKKFKEITLNSTVIMGRNTFESIDKKPLPDRENFVLTHRPEPNKEHLKFFNSLDEALAHVQTPRAFIMGGERVFREALSEQFINQISGVYLTQIHQTIQGDAYFPELSKSTFVEKKRELLLDNPKIELIYFENRRGTSNPRP